MIISTLGLIGNVYVIHVYTIKPLTPGKLFLTSIALLNICIIISATLLIPFLYDYPRKDNGLHVYISPSFILQGLINAFIYAYLWIMSNMAVDRVWAVFRPYVYTQRWNRPLIITAFCMLAGLLVLICSLIWDPAEINTKVINRKVFSVCFVVTYIIIICSYSAIVIKLRSLMRVNATNQIQLR